MLFVKDALFNIHTWEQTGTTTVGQRCQRGAEEVGVNEFPASFLKGISAAAAKVKWKLFTLLSSMFPAS